MIVQLFDQFSLVSEFQKLLIALAILFFCWLALYLPHLRTAPGWYGDEFLTLISGNSILHHTWRDRALPNSFFRTLLNYQPIATFLFAFFSEIITDGDILGARLLSILLAFVIASLVCIILARRKKLLLGFAAALTILAAPQCVIHFRWVYPHYFLSLGVIIIGLTLDAPRTKRRDWILGTGAALGAMGHLLIVPVTLGVLLARISYPRSWLKIIIPPGLILCSSLLLGYISGGKSLVFDLQGLCSFYATCSNSTNWLQKMMNIWKFFSIDWFHLLLLVSFVGIAYARKWGLLVFSAFIVFAVIQNRPEITTYYYQSMVFIPLLCVNLILSLDIFFSRILYVINPLPQHDSDWQRELIRCLLLLFLPLFLLPGSLKHSLTGSFKARNDFWVTPSCRDLEQTAVWINQHTSKDDFVVAYWDSEWLLTCRSTDILQCAAWQYGIGSITTYNRPYARQEFLWPADVRLAKYIFVSPIDLRWSYIQGTVPQLIRETEIGDWPIVFKTNTTYVLLNPAFKE